MWMDNNPWSWSVGEGVCPSESFTQVWYKRPTPPRNLTYMYIYIPQMMCFLNVSPFNYGHIGYLIQILDGICWYKISPPARHSISKSNESKLQCSIDFPSQPPRSDLVGKCWRGVLGKCGSSILGEGEGWDAMAGYGRYIRIDHGLCACFFGYVWCLLLVMIWGVHLHQSVSKRNWHIQASGSYTLVSISKKHVYIIYHTFVFLGLPDILHQ